MNDRPNELVRGEEARLFPVASSRQKETHALSTLLAVFRLIPKYAERMLKDEARALTLTPTRLRAYTEVRFKAQSKDSRQRAKVPQPDGYIVVESRGKQWSALVEAKVKNDELKPNQLEMYLDLAREIKADAVLTISNQFALDPTHHPVPVSGRKTRSIGLYHLSWLSLLSNARILADSDELTDDEQAFVLRELIRFLNDDKSGVRPFDRMGPEWKELCIAIQHGKPLAKGNDLVAAAVGDWQQLTRYLALKLSPRIGQSVSVYIKRSHRHDPAKRFEADANDLIKTHCFNDDFDIENAASRIQLTANLAKRHMVLSMELAPPADKKRPKATIRWLTRQLDKLTNEKMNNVHLRADWPGRTPWTMKPLQECIGNPDVLVPEGMSDLPTKLKVQRIDYLGGRFVGARTVVEDVENAFKEFYENIGQNLRKWTPPPPKYRQQQDGSQRKKKRDVPEAVSESTSTATDSKEVLQEVRVDTGNVPSHSAGNGDMTIPAEPDEPSTAFSHSSHRARVDDDDQNRV